MRRLRIRHAVRDRPPPSAFADDSAAPASLPIFQHSLKYHRMTLKSTPSRHLQWFKYYPRRACSPIAARSEVAALWASPAA
jgi:hypothetical protein